MTNSIPKFKFGKRVMLARVLDASGALGVLKNFAPKTLHIFSYHRIRAPGAVSIFDDELYTATAAEFRQDLEVLKEQATPVAESDLLAFIKHGKPLPRHAFMITFDDGYRDNFEVAAPILKDLGIPAIFFVATGQVEERSLGWWDIIMWCLKRTEKKCIVVRGIEYKLTNNPEDTGKIFKRMMKDSTLNTQNLVDEIREACEVSMPSIEICDKELMNWDQIKACEKYNIAIGSHTHSHRVLSCINLDSQRKELVLSKHILESKLGRPVCSIAYPVGGYEHFNIETMELAKECGYEMGFSFLTGSNWLNDFSSFDIKRMDRQTDASVYRGIFSMPGIFGKRTCEAPKPNHNTQNAL